MPPFIGCNFVRSYKVSNSLVCFFIIIGGLYLFKSNEMGRMKEVFEREREMTEHLKVDMFSYEEMKHYFKSVANYYAGKSTSNDKA
tara:strand:+ start:749 stop:1006 length:258 start_codon:yes stop_codon:yes gene_type:complete